MYSVQVLLSAYNGEKYLCDQIDSILNQKDVNVSLLVRDDGSCDRTSEILKMYSEKYENFEYICEKNIGVVASFFKLFQMSDENADCFALSDQDDVWDPDKLVTACKQLEKSKNKVPAMYSCNAVVTDGNMNPLPEKFQEKGRTVRADYKNALIENISRGGGIVVNSKLMEYLRRPLPENIYMHDWWIYLVASCFGDVYHDSDTHYSYRQHVGNVLGAAPKGFAKIARRLRQSRDNKGHILRQIESFSREYEIPDGKMESTNVILNYRKSLKWRMKGVSGKYLFRQNKMDDLIFRLMFFSNHL